MNAPRGVQVIRKNMIFCVKCVNYTCILDHKTDLSDVTSSFADLLIINICNMYLKPGHDLYFGDLKEICKKKKSQHLCK